MFSRFKDIHFNEEMKTGCYDKKKYSLVLIDLMEDIVHHVQRKTKSVNTEEVWPKVKVIMNSIVK